MNILPINPYLRYFIFWALCTRKMLILLHPPPYLGHLEEYSPMIAMFIFGKQSCAPSRLDIPESPQLFNLIQWEHCMGETNISRDRDIFILRNWMASGVLVYLSILFQRPEKTLEYNTEFVKIGHRGINR